ncbi:MAG: FtsW/RodA/SpoVE family cell cycle protein [Lachnospiraceae bacterium]|nr:FtsW/RodA/SpoVE family cell cycle protein [Lachnospiraceae bacterium]
MIHIITTVSRFTMIFIIAVYTYYCFSALGRPAEERGGLFKGQMVYIYLLLLNANAVLFLNTNDIRIIIMAVAEAVLIYITNLIYKKLYSNANEIVVNNMCMLLLVGFIMLCRLDMGQAIKQIVYAAAALLITAFVPIMIERWKMWSRLSYLYAAIGILGLLCVAVFGKVVYGAKLNISIGPVTLQPSEIIKIIFVFFVASMLCIYTDLKQVIITSAISAVFVLILVASKDLGSAMIYFVTFLFMLYVATRNWTYLFAGFLMGGGAAIAGYHLFSHVRTRVIAWQDPLAVVNDAGYQISRSLFAIGSGGWFGSGLYEGMPEKIPVVTTDFIFAAISEEMGAVFALCIIFICISCILMFFNIAMQIHERFYKLVALGLAVCYGIQVFITLGGVTKFIPSTGVTLPLISYGGSSILSTIFIFAVIQGLYKRAGWEAEADNEIK